MFVRAREQSYLLEAATAAVAARQYFREQMRITRSVDHFVTFSLPRCCCRCRRRDSLPAPSDHAGAKGAHPRLLDEDRSRELLPGPQRQIQGGGRGHPRDGLGHAA